MNTSASATRKVVIGVKLGNEEVAIEVPSETKDYTFHVLLKDARRDVQKKNYLALMALLAAAYRVGQASK